MDHPFLYFPTGVFFYINKLQIKGNVRVGDQTILSWWKLFLGQSNEQPSCIQSVHYYARNTHKRSHRNI